MTFPRFLRVRQQFDAPTVADIPAEIKKQLSSLNLQEKIQPGDSVAITAGSRGIANIALITRETVKFFQSLGAKPFIVPAMGSHGGGTAEGQQQILENYGITAEYTGAEIRSSMETVIIDETPQSIPVHFDKHAYEADHVVVCGRVKPHTGFVGEIESGIHKMMLIGLGKHEGAKIYHRAIQNYSFLEIIRAVADVVMKKCNIVAGLGIVENALDQTGLLDAIAPENFFEREKELLTISRKWLPRLPFTEVDVLIVDEIGKDMSGSGMDTNIIGRKFNDNRAMEGDQVRCKRIFVRGLTEMTHGNACGIGIAEFITQDCANQIDHEITRINCVTGGHPTGGAVPLTYPNDQEAFTAALQTIGLTEPENARVIHISNTLHLSEVLVSEAYLPELEGRKDLTILQQAAPTTFDSKGKLNPVSQH